MGVESFGGGAEYWKPEPEKYKSPEVPKTPEAAFEKEPALHRRLWQKNKLISQMYGYVSGQTHTSPLPQVKTPAEAMSAYLDMTASAPPLPPLPPVIPVDLPGVLYSDPFANDPSRMTSEDRATTSAFFSFMRRDASQARTAVDTMDAALAKFIDDFSAIPEVPVLDKADVANRLKGKTGLRNFRESIMQLVAKYLVLKKKLGTNSQEDLEKVLTNGFYAYAKTYSSDIPYYDRVYQDFDSERLKGRTPQEVYLGRDGMYAYLGRRAHDLSKRRAMGIIKRIEAKNAGKKIEIKPKYLVYPRFYRDQLHHKTKAVYLKSQGISRKTDPMFFDTGYTGTVPEQILNILGMGGESDRRIKMLSAQAKERRVNGIPPEERHNIVEKIEYNMKPEEPSSGIMRTENGRLKPVAKPTTPEEQFIFGMIRLALVRHYWLEVRSKNS